MDTSKHKVFYEDTYAREPKKGEKLGIRIWKKKNKKEKRKAKSGSDMVLLEMWMVGC